MKSVLLKKGMIWKFFLSFLLLLSGLGNLSCSDSETDDVDPINIEISLDKSNETIKVGQTLAIVPTLKGADADKQEYIWTSSNTSVATIVKNADNSATVTALAKGTTVVKIESIKYSQFSATCSITVTEDPIEPEEPEGTIRILAIGNSFSQDAVEQYLYELAQAEGIDIVVANLYIGGCSLETHVSNARNNSAAYEYRKVKDGVKTSKSGITMATGLGDEDWDYICLQQVSGNSGLYETFAASLPELVQYVKDRATNKKMKLMMHQTWAYAANSTHADFPKYDKDQVKMYNAIVDAVNRAAQLVNIEIVIPSGTAIQNGRTSYIGDNFTRDGYHLEVTYGRYTAACTWFEKIFGRNVVGNSYAPEGLHSSKVAVAQNAAHTAVLKPNAVTVLNEYKNPPIDTEVMKTPLYIDFGSSASATPWNNISSNAATADGTTLIDTDGDYTKFKIRVSKGFSSVYAGVGTEPTGAVDVGFEVPVTAFRDGFLVSDDNPGELQISNLSPSLKYTLTIIGLRWNSSVDRMTDYKITGKSTSTHSLAVGTKDANAIKDKYVTVAGIEPDAAGNITIEVSRGADNPHQAVISALQIRLTQ